MAEGRVGWRGTSPWWLFSALALVGCEDAAPARQAVVFPPPGSAGSAGTAGAPQINQGFSAADWSECGRIAPDTDLPAGIVPVGTDGVAVTLLSGSVLLYRGDETPYTLHDRSIDNGLPAVFSPDGKLSAKRELDGVMRVRSTLDGSLMSTLPPFDPTCGAEARFAADSQHLLLGASPGIDDVTHQATCAVELASGSVVARVPLWLYAVAFQSDQFVGPTDPGSFAVFDATGQPSEPTSLPVDAQDIKALVLSPAGDRVAYVSSTRAQLFDRANGALLADLAADSATQAALFSADGSFVLLGRRVLRSDDATLVAELLPSLSRPLWLSVDGQHVGLEVGGGTAERRFMLLDASTSTPVRAFGGQTRAVLSVAVSPDGKRFATANSLAFLVWNLADDFGDSSLAWVAQTSQGFSSQFSPDGSLLAISGDRRAVFSAEGVTLFDPAPPVDVNDCPWRHFDFSPDGRFLAGGASEFFVDVFDAGTRELVTRLPSSSCNSTAAFSADGSFLVTGALETYFTKDWSPVSPGPVAPVPATQNDNDAMNRVIFAPDGRHLLVSRCQTQLPGAIGTCSYRLLLAGGGAGAQALSLTAPHAEFSPDGGNLVAGGTLLQLSTHAQSELGMNVVSAAFAASGDIIAGGSEGSIIRFCRKR